MLRRLPMLFALLGLLLAGPVRAQADETALLAQVSEALWPGDIVRAADRYLHAFPNGSAAATVDSERLRAAQTWRLLGRNELRLYRSAFARPADPDALHELRRAALGDSAAAVRLANASRASDSAAVQQRWVGWLQLASLLGDERASYELALHFRRTDQPVLAARYETLAVALGFRPAPSLDHSRK